MDIYNNKVIIILIATTAVLAVFGFFLLYFIVYLRIKKNSFYIEKQMLTGALENRDGQADEAERALNEGSKMIHDNILQQCCLLRMDVNSFKKYVFSENQLESISNTLNRVDQLISDAKQTCFWLYSDVIRSTSLPATLDGAIKDFFSESRIRFDVVVTGETRALQPHLKLVVFRIAWEAITNSCRHSAASAVRVTVDYRRDYFLLSISDDGLGFSKEKLQALQSTGLANMYRRAKYLNAELNIESVPGDGCLVMLSCPG